LKNGKKKMKKKEIQFYELQSGNFQLQELLKTSNELVEMMKLKIKKLEEEKNSYSNSNTNVKDDSDQLISEIESLTAAHDQTLKQNQKLLKIIGEKDVRIKELLDENVKYSTENRAIRDEKSALIVKCDKLKAIAQEHETRLTRIEERNAIDRSAALKSEELAKISFENVEKYKNECDQYKLEIEKKIEAEKLAKSLQEQALLEVTKFREKNEETKQDLSRTMEEKERLNKKLERFRNELELDAARKKNANRNIANYNGIDKADRIRMEQMELALRCPVYQHLWKDCVIVKCSHSFSRKALEDNLNQRNRKCPICKCNFSKDDILPLFLYASNEKIQ